jgi:hypothetical protein
MVRLAYTTLCIKELSFYIKWSSLTDHLKTELEIGWLKTIPKLDTNFSGFGMFPAF